MAGARILLAVLLLLTAAAKLRPAEDALVSGVLAWAAVAVETLAALAILFGRPALGAGIALVLAAGGVALAMMPLDASCGCLGRDLEMSRTQHLWLSAFVGFLACLALWPEPAARSISRAPGTASPGPR